MIDYTQAFVLALVQGITEFLPISSSGHLVLMPQLLGWPDQGLAFDVAVHVGSLIAVLVYFRKDLRALGRSAGTLLRGRQGPDDRLLLQLAVATVPVIVVGYLLDAQIESHLRGHVTIAVATIGFGILLWVSDFGTKSRRLVDMNLGLASLIGLAQVLALIPGTSRAGITMTAALFLGFYRVDAARFCFLLSIPVIAFAGLYKGAAVLDDPQLDGLTFLFGAVVAAIGAYACIAAFIGLVERIGVWPFAVYRIFLGVLILLLL